MNALPEDLVEQLGLLTAQQVAKLFQVKIDWVYDQCQAGKLPHVKAGQQLRFTRTQIATYIQDHSKTPPSDGSSC